MTDDATPPRGSPGFHLAVAHHGENEDATLPRPGESQFDRVERVLSDVYFMGRHTASELALERIERARVVKLVRADVEACRGEIIVQSVMVSKTDSKLDVLARDVDGIAKKMGVTRTFSGQVRLSVPAPPVAPVVDVVEPRSYPRGSSPDLSDELVVPRREYEAFVTQVNIDKAEERGAKAEIERLKSEAKEFRERVTLLLALLIALGGLFTWLISHTH
jgi:hypothetical protein